MAVFPTDDVQRIIDEEILRGAGNTLWTKPKARLRYQVLLANLVIGDRHDRPQVMRLLADIFNAHYELSRFATDSDRIWGFAPDAIPGLMGFQKQVSGVFVGILNARDVWPADACVPLDGVQALLEDQVKSLDAEIKRATKALETNSPIGMHSRRAVQLDEALQAARYGLLTRTECLEFDDFYNRAQALLRQSAPLFDMRPDVSVN